MRCLGLTFGRHDTFVCVGCLGELSRTLLPSIALLCEFSQLASLLLHETLVIRQSRFGDLTGLIRVLRQPPGFHDRDLPILRSCVSDVWADRRTFCS